MSKYLTRNSPPFSAKDYPNQIKKGNDNLNYVSIKDKNNVYKWIKYIDTNMPEPNKYKDNDMNGDKKLTWKYEYN